jgi:hypothetical protein
MSQNYVPNGTMLVCMTGTKMSRLQVSHQSNSKMLDGRLIGTCLDKMEDNHYCMLMSTVGAAIGALAGLAMSAALGVGVIGVALLVVGGAFAGSLINRIPCICAMITMPFWIPPHPTVRIAGIHALPEKSLLPCMLGGPVKIMMLDMPKVIAYAKLCEDSYKEVSEGNIDGYEEATGVVDTSMLNDEASGLFARLYKSGDNYVLVFRGTEKGNWKDIKTDGIQGAGLTAEQYQKATELTAKIKKALKDNPDTQNTTFELAGHSMGGGEAALSAADNDLEAYTFNAAGVHENSYKYKDENGKPVTMKENIYAFHAQDRDILNTLQDNRSVLSFVPILGDILIITKGLPTAAGQRIGMETDASIMDLINLKGHGIEDDSPLFKSLQKELQDYKPVSVKSVTI